MKEKWSSLVRKLWFPAILFLLPFPFLALTWQYPTYYDGYAITTKNLAEKGIYSLDGVHPFVGKQPPGFSILSVPFHYTVGFPHAVKVSGTFWTGLAAVCFYYLLGATGISDGRRLLSLLYLFNPETLSEGPQRGMSEPAITFLLVAGVLLLVHHHRKLTIPLYLLAGVALGFAPLVRFPGVAFTLCYVAYSLYHVRRLRGWILPGLAAASIPLGIWISRPDAAAPSAPRPPEVSASRPTESPTDPGGGKKAPEKLRESFVPVAIKDYFRHVTFRRAPGGQWPRRVLQETFGALVTEAARIYLLLLPFVYLGAGCILASRKETGGRLLPLIVCGWVIYLGGHILFGNMIPRYLLPIVPFAFLFAGFGLKGWLGRPVGRAALSLVLVLHALVSLPFVYAPAADAWTHLVGADLVPRRAKVLRNEAELVHWVNRNVPDGATILDRGHGTEAAYRQDTRIVVGDRIGMIPPPYYVVNYGEEYSYVGYRLEEDALSRGEVSVVTWAYRRDYSRGFFHRERDLSVARQQPRTYPELEAEIVFDSAGAMIQVVKVVAR